MKGGLSPDGTLLTAYRSPKAPGFQWEGEMSFQDWKEDDPLPAYQDDVTGYALGSPPDDTSLTSAEKPTSWPKRQPFHPSFGPRSAVKVHLPWREKGDEMDQKEDNSQMGREGMFGMLENLIQATDKYEAAIAGQLEAAKPVTRSKKTERAAEFSLPQKKITRRPVSSGGIMSLWHPKFPS